MTNFDTNGIVYTPINISEQANYEKLLALGHISQVPFLYDTDNNIKMYESDKIIAYVEKNYRAV